MNSETRDFPIGAVLSTVTGRLVSENGITGIYEVLNWMTGESVYTHQLPRISREATPVLVAMHPTLSKAIEEASEVNGDNWRSWLDTWTKRYGATLAVPRLTEDQHERIDPLSELAEKVHPSRIAVVAAAPSHPQGERE